MKALQTTPANRDNDVGLFSFGNNLPSHADLVFLHTTSIGGFYFSGSDVRSLSFPNLVSIDPTNILGGDLSTQAASFLVSLSVPKLQVSPQIVIASNPALSVVSFPSLTSVLGVNIFGNFDAFACAGVTLSSFSAPLLATCGGQVDFSACVATVNLPSLTAITRAGLVGPSFGGATFSAPLLTTIQGNVVFGFSTNLVTFNVPVWLPQANTQITFNSCPNLSLATVNMILHRCVANAAFAGASSQVTLDGPAPSGQGATDKATLIGRGCTVVTN